MSNGAAIEALMQGPEAKVVETFKLTLPEGPSRRENNPVVDKGRSTGDYAQGDDRPARRCASARELGAPRDAQDRRGLPVPRDLQADRRARARATSSSSSSTRSRENFAKVDMKTAAASAT